MVEEDIQTQVKYFDKIESIMKSGRYITLPWPHLLSYIGEGNISQPNGET